MNAEHLLQHFDRISEAPDAIPRLRRFILDLAVRGKLVEQDPNDEPASELLKRIQAEKEKAGFTPRRKDAKKGEKSGEENLGAFAPLRAMAFAIPGGWEWEQLGSVTTKTGSGSTPSGGHSVYQANGVPFLRSQNIYNDGLRLNDVAYIDEITHAKMNGTAVESGDILLNITGGSIGRCCRIPDTTIQANISQHVAIVRLAVAEMRDFIHKVILSPFFQSFVIDEQTGAGRGGLPKNRMDRILIPLPPLAEQQRIVAKVNELMALCDQLEAAKNKRETRRDRLVKASLQRICVSEPEEAREAARFHLDNLPRLSTRSEHIKQLRQTILDLAVRGKLVEQDPNDEPAAELLKRILAEKMRLIKEGIQRKEKPIAGLENEDLPYPIPNSWQWSQLAEIGFISPRNIASDDLAASFVPMPMIFAEYGISNQHEVRTWSEIKTGYTHFAEGDIGLAKITPCFENGKSTVFRHLTGKIGAGTTELHIVRPIFVNADYLLIFLKCPHFINSGIPKMTGTAGQKRVPAQYFSQSPLPLPPLAEQHRIVAKVDELIALCDQLDAQLTTTETDSRRLLATVLHKALIPSLEETT
jgi:type I restriction enzyme S subunit